MSARERGAGYAPMRVGLDICQRVRLAVRLAQEGDGAWLDEMDGALTDIMRLAAAHQRAHDGKEQAPAPRRPLRPTRRRGGRSAEHLRQHYLNKHKVATPTTPDAGGGR